MQNSDFLFLTHSLYSIEKEKAVWNFEYATKNKKALKSKKFLFLHVSVVQSFQPTVPHGFSFPSNKLKLICSITFHSHVYEDFDRKLGRWDKLVGLRLKSFNIIINWFFISNNINKSNVIVTNYLTIFLLNVDVTNLLLVFV